MSLCQQFELYAAEGDVQQGRTFETRAQLQAWVDDLRETGWWDRFYPMVKGVEVFFIPPGRGSVGAYFKDRLGGQIEMAPGHRNELTVCHELAHVLANARYGASCGHSPWFARVYLELVHSVMGTDAYTELYAAFESGGVEHDPPRQDVELGRVREMPA